MNFLLCFIFHFRSKMSFVLDRKCYVRNWTVNQVLWHRHKWLVFGRKQFHFRRHFRLRPKMKNASSVSLYIKLFQTTPYVNDWNTQQPPFRAAYRCLETIIVLLSIFDIVIIHHHRRRRVVRVNRCAAPWPMAISDLHSVDSCSRALASSWTLLS